MDASCIDCTFSLSFTHPLHPTALYRWPNNVLTVIVHNDFWFRFANALNFHCSTFSYVIMCMWMLFVWRQQLIEKSFSIFRHILAHTIAIPKKHSFVKGQHNFYYKMFSSSVSNKWNIWHITTIAKLIKTNSFGFLWCFFFRKYLVEPLILCWCCRGSYCLIFH